MTELCFIVRCLLLAYFCLLKKEAVNIIAVETELTYNLSSYSDIHNNTTDARTYMPEAKLPRLKFLKMCMIQSFENYSTVD